MTRITLDTSAAAAWLLPDEASDAADGLFLRAHETPGLFQAPALWSWECGNLLLMAQRRGRLDVAGLRAVIELLDRLPLTLEPAPDLQRWLAVMECARQHRLTFYDASYLEQALRTGASLWTQDAQLRRAATTAGVECLDIG